MADFPYGVYKILSAVNTNQAVTVPNESLNSETMLQVYEMSDVNSQKILITSFDNISDAKRLVFVHSGLAIDVRGGVFKSEQDVWQYYRNITSLAQSWEIHETDRFKRYNGVDVPIYKIMTSGTAEGPDSDNPGASTPEVSGTHYALDVKAGMSGGAINSTKIWIYTPNDTEAQYWIIMPDSAVDSSWEPVANLGWFMGDESKTTELVHSMPIIAASTGTTDTLWPAFKCPSNLYQIRYRYRYRKAKSEAWTQMSNWISYKGSSFEQEGWSDARYHMYSIEDETAIRNDNGIIRPIDGIQVSLDPGAVVNAYDKAEFEFEARVFGISEIEGWNDIPTHSPSSNSIMTVCITPNIIVNPNDIQITSNGIKIPYRSSFERGGNIITVSSIRIDGKILFQDDKSFTFDNKDYVGSIIVPNDDFVELPVDGHVVSFQITIQTCDGIKNSKWIEKAPSRDSLHTMSITVKQNIYGYANNLDISVSDGKDIIPISSLKNKKCILMYDHDGREYRTLCEETSNGFRVYPPFNTQDYRLYVVVEGSNGHWGDLIIVKPLSVEGRGNIFTYNGNVFDLSITDQPNITPKRSVAHNVSKYGFEGDIYDSSYFGSSSSATLQVEGIVCNDKFEGNKYGMSTLDDFRALCMNKYAVLRNTQGDRYDIAITNWSEDPTIEPGLWKVNINMNERPGM